MNPNTPSNLPTNQNITDNQNDHQNNSISKKKSKNKKKQSIETSNSNILAQNQQCQPQKKIPEQNDSRDLSFTQLEQDIQHIQKKGFQKPANQDENQTNQQWTNFSSQQTISNSRKRSFSSEQQMNQQIETKFERKERNSCFVRPIDSRQKQIGVLSKISQNESISEKQILANEIKIACESNQEEGRFGFTQPVRESNANLVNFIDKQNIDGQLYLDNPFNPDVCQHSNQIKVSQYQYVQNCEEQSAKSEDQNEVVVIPERVEQDFVMNVQMETQLHRDFITGEFQSNPDETYEKRYEMYYPRNRNDARIHFKITKKTIQGLKIISINCDKNIHFKKTWAIKTYHNTTDLEVLRQMIKAVIRFMRDGYDFILLQQACDPIFQILLTQAIDKFNKKNGEIYFYPQHLPKDTKNLRITTILTKHQVKMGQFRFKLKEFPGYPQFTPRLPMQAFVEFRIKIIDKWENVCIFCCHLNSNRGRQGQQASLSGQVRKRQVDAIVQFSKGFDRFISVGDTNIPTSSQYDQENKYVDSKLFDAINYGISEIRDTYLYRNRAKKVHSQRNDRAWVDKKSALTTSVLITYHDILLEACEGLNLDQTKMLEQADHNVFPYITVNDHTILDLEIMFTK